MRKAIAYFANGLGNFVMMMPALQAMASLTREGKVDLCINDQWSDHRRPVVEEICQAWPIIDKIIRYPKEKISTGEYSHWFFSAHGVSNDAAHIFLQRMHRIIPKPPWRTSKMHEVDHYMAIARGAGYEGQMPKVQFPISDKPVINLLRPIIGLCNGYFRTSTHYWDKKEWPYFPKLSEVLSSFFSRSIVGLGRQNEIPKGTKLVVDYSGKLSILETAKVLSQLDLLITTDTGLMHVGDALGIPLIAVFGPTLTTKNAPRGKNSYVLQSGLNCVPCQETSTYHICKSNECMKSVTISDVMAKTRQILREGR